MGNSNTRSRRASDAAKPMPAKTKDKNYAKEPYSGKDFGKSVSMPVIERDKKGTANGTPQNGTADKKGSKTQSMKRADSTVKRADFPTAKQAPSLRRRSTSARYYSNNAPRKSIRRDISHPITVQGREIIVQCFDNPHSEFGNKVCQRVFEKRPDYQNYIHQMGKERAYQMTQKLKDLVESIVSRIDDVDHIMTASRTYGEEHVELKGLGFKPDFWVALADAMTVEGVILDMANHQPADTVGAWSQLVSLIFSAVRDGYYSALRVHRMNSRRNLARQATNDSSSNVETASSSRQNSISGRCTEVCSSPRTRTSVTFH